MTFDSDSLQRVLTRADELHGARCFDDALRLVDEALEEAPHHSGLLVRRGVLLQLSSEASPLDAVRGTLREAAKVDPSNVRAKLELGFYLYAVDDDAAAAVEHFAAARDLAVIALRDAVLGEIKCHLELQRWPDAARALDQAACWFPEDPDVTELRAELLGNDGAGPAPPGRERRDRDT